MLDGALSSAKNNPLCVCVCVFIISLFVVMICLCIDAVNSCLWPKIPRFLFFKPRILNKLYYAVCLFKVLIKLCLKCFMCFFFFCIDWVDVANNILLKCHINLRLERISECDANVFVALYEAILGEKVPGIHVPSVLCKNVSGRFCVFALLYQCFPQV